MNLSWVLLLLTAAPEPIYIYVDDPPDMASQHVLDALKTPTNLLQKRCTANPSTQKYLLELEWARHDLMETRRYIIKTRDEARLPSYVKLPGWALSFREQVPRSFHPQCSYLWTAVPEYLRYMAQIHQYGISKEPSTSYILGVRSPSGQPWITSTGNTAQYTGTWRGHPAVIEEKVYKTYLRFTPPSFVELGGMPYRTITSFDWIDGEIKGSATETIDYRVTKEALLDILTKADMETEVILPIPHPEEEAP